MIQRAMKDSHISLHLNQNAKKQALEIIAILKKTMRIERMQMLIQITCAKRSTTFPFLFTSRGRDSGCVLQGRGSECDDEVRARDEADLDLLHRHSQLQGR